MKTKSRQTHFECCKSQIIMWMRVRKQTQKQKSNWIKHKWHIGQGRFILSKKKKKRRGKDIQYQRRDHIRINTMNLIFVKWWWRLIQMYSHPVVPFDVSSEKNSVFYLFLYSSLGIFSIRSENRFRHSLAMLRTHQI